MKYAVKFTLDTDGFTNWDDAQKVFDFFHANKDAWKRMLKEMDALGYYSSPGIELFESNTGSQEFLPNSINEKKETIKCLDLDQGDEEICGIFSPATE